MLNAGIYLYLHKWTLHFYARLQQITQEAQLLLGDRATRKHDKDS